MATAARIDWEPFAIALRAEYGDRVVDEAIERLKHGDVWDYHGEIGVKVRADLGDNRTASGAKNYWPSGDGVWDAFDCRCREMQRRRVCGHALAAHLYREWLDQQEEDDPPGSVEANRNHKSR